MHRFLPYTILFVAVTLLQTLFFNNLSVSILLAPLVYVSFIVLLPLQTTHLLTLIAGVAMGVVMDMTMGVAGVNSIATMFIAFVRPYIINMMLKKDIVAGGGIPSELMFGVWGFMRYLVVLVAVHHFVFFAFESLSLENLNLYVFRFFCSSCISILAVWLISRVFSAIVFSYRK